MAALIHSLSTIVTSCLHPGGQVGTKNKLATKAPRHEEEKNTLRLRSGGQVRGKKKSAANTKKKNTLVPSCLSPGGQVCGK